jgi:cytochrome c oxidase subunit II
MIDPSNYTFGLPIAASTYAGKVDKSLDILHVAMTVIFVLWGIFFTIALVKFRRGANPKGNYEASKGGLASFLPDVAVLLFEVWLIFVVGLPIWAEIKEDFPPANGALVVDMVAEQFAWTFQYAGPDGVLGSRDPKRMNATNQLGLDRSEAAAKDDVASINELHVPLGRPTIIYMTSKDVIHSLFVPEFRVKQDVVPGMRSPLWFEPTQVGRFEIGCAQLCGLGHYRMRGEVVVHTPEDFAAWEAEQQKTLQEEQAS